MRARARTHLQALGKKVERLRLQKGWNRTTLADKAGVTITTIRGVETATKVTQPEKLRQIATALGTTLKHLEADDSKEDPRVRQWTDEDYDIGNWYHNAPRQLKNQVWALHEVTGAGAALLDPQFATLLEGWPKLSQQDKVFVLNSLTYILQHPSADPGGADAVAPTDSSRTRGSQR